MFFENWAFSMPNSIFSYCCNFVHDYYMHVMMFGFFIMSFISIISTFSGHSYKFNFKRNDSRGIEMILQFLVINLLILMIGPGFWLIQYQGRMFFQPEMTLKVSGHQWYWSYEYGDSDFLRFDSFIKSLDDLNVGVYRMFEVDNRCIIPVDVNLGIYCTSTDVIHSFAVPKCFLKMDALMGLLTKVTHQFPVVGVYYGQCSEICGANHSFMPIVLEITSLECWKDWVLSFF
uniref:cytochrome-c oxidase n=1 Tax=Gongylonema pulchrum TaxID=637853 RepID=A0A0D3MTG0_9BILA|nr:cytochrome c oxidase subunit II [Gongylonema pulchrum]AIY56391.1 cytochrome c oxidase subunit 2 [Gongylonema pulchrum]